MAARTRVLQLGIVIVNLTLIGLAFTSIWPFPHGDFKVHLPSARNVSWSYADGIVGVTAPYSIDNGGFYDVDNLVVKYSVNNSTGYHIAGSTFDLGKISKGTTTSGALSFTINLVQLYEDGIQWMVFNDDFLNFDIHVSCFYTMKLIKFDASYTTGVVWDALIKSWAIHPVPPLPSVPTSVDYWLNTSRLLSGIPPATLNLSIARNGTVLGWEQTEIQLGGNRNGSLSLSTISGFDPVVPGDYAISYSFRVAEYVLSGSWGWTVPPTGGLL